MRPKGKTTMRSLAAELGVSAMTVSRALSGRRKMDTALAERVRALALVRGYRTDPLVSGVMRSLKRKPQTRERPSLAFVWTSPRAHAEREEAGAKAEADRLGYHLEIVRPWLQGLEPCDVTRILWSKGVRGVLLAPNEGAPRPCYEMDRDGFAVVLLGSSLVNAGLPRVQSDHYQATETAMVRLRAAGYRRVAMVLDQNYNERTSRTISAAFLAYSENHDALGLAHLIPAERRGAERRAAFLAWLEEARADALLADVPQRLEWLKDAGWRVPDDIGFATLTLQPEETDLAGVVHGMERVGAEALRLLDRMICNNEIGLHTEPTKLLVPGRWRNGPTIAGRSHSAKAVSPR